MAWSSEFAASMGAAAAGNWIALGASVVAFFSFAVALATFIWQSAREHRVELQENYLRLELESNAVFRYEAEHGDVLAVYKASVKPADYAPNAKNESLADQFYLQQLNLFEIAARFRRGQVFDKAIFGSWVIWFHDVTRSWWFRERWPSDYSDNYTPDLFNIFTPMAAYFAREITADEDEAHAFLLKEAFFQHVAALFDCDIVLEWLSRRPTYALLRLTKQRAAPPIERR